MATDAPNPNTAVSDGQGHTPEAIPAECLRTSLQKVLQGKDLGCVSVGEIRKQVSVRLGFPDDGLDCRKKEIRKLTTDIVAELLSEAGLPPVIPFAQQLLDLKGEKADARQYVYLVTISRVLVAILADGRGYKDLQEMSRKEIADALRDSLSNSMQDSAGRGRPRNAEAEPLVLSVFVFRECHADGSFHFHATRGSRGHSRVTPDRRSRTSAAHTH
jgi:hypothetical protein